MLKQAPINTLALKPKVLLTRWAMALRNGAMNALLVNKGCNSGLSSNQASTASSLSEAVNKKYGKAFASCAERSEKTRL